MTEKLNFDLGKLGKEVAGLKEELRVKTEKCVSLQDALDNACVDKMYVLVYVICRVSFIFGWNQDAFFGIRCLFLTCWGD